MAKTPRKNPDDEPKAAKKPAKKAAKTPAKKPAPKPAPKPAQPPAAPESPPETTPGRVQYSEALGERVCALIAEGKSAAVIGQMPGMPCRRTIQRWVETNETFRTAYVAAKEDLADRFAEEIIAIADDGANDTYKTEDGAETNYDHIQRSKLRVDARKWVASKLAPKKYGDRQQIDLNDERGVSTEELLLRARTAAEKLGLVLPPHLEAMAADDDED